MRNYAKSYARKQMRRTARSTAGFFWTKPKAKNRRRQPAKNPR